jgi:hypothetical protein
MPDVPRPSGKLLDILRRVGGLDLGILAGGILMLGFGLWRFVVQPEPLGLKDLLLCGVWILIGLLIGLTLSYLLQHARIVFYLLFLSLLVFAYFYPHFAVGQGCALAILMGADIVGTI